MSSRKKILLALSLAVLAVLVMVAVLRVIILTRRVRALENIISSRRKSPLSQPTGSIQEKSVPPDESQHEVLNVVDGDAMTIETGEDSLQVRISGIDDGETPTLASDDRISDIPVQPYLVQSTGTGINAAPIANAGPGRTVEQESYAGTEVTLDSSGSTDSDSTWGTNDDIVSFDWYEGGTHLGSRKIMQYTFPPGTHTVALVVTDSFGQRDDDTVTIRVVDTTPPEVKITSPEEIAYLNTQGPVPVLGVVEDRCDPSPEVEVLLDREVFTEDSIDLGKYIGETEHTLKIAATDQSSKVGEDSVTFKVVPRPMRSFLIEKAEIVLAPDQRFGDKDIFFISGSFELPEGYQRADLERSVVLYIQIGGTEGKDETALTDLGRAWSYSGSASDDSLGQRIDIKRMDISWSFPTSSFLIIGELSLPLEGIGTVTLEIPVAPYEEAGSVAGKETFAFEKV